MNKTLISVPVIILVLFPIKNYQTNPNVSLKSLRKFNRSNIQFLDMKTITNPESHKTVCVIFQASISNM